MVWRVALPGGLLLVGLLVVVGYVTSSTSASGERLLGDVDCNQQVNSVDAALILQVDAGLLVGLQCGDAADVTQDGATNAVDAALVLQFNVGLLGGFGKVPSVPTLASTATPIFRATLPPISTSTPTPTFTAVPTNTATATNTASPTDTVTPMPTIPTDVPPGQITYIVDPGVAEEELASIQDGIIRAGEFLDSHLGGRVQGLVEVLVTTEDACSGNPATAGVGEICIYTGHPVWVEAAPFQWAKIAAHEYYHTLQFELECFDPPVWLNEGSAEFVAYAVVIEAGLIAEPDTKSFHVAQVVNSTPPLPPLSEILIFPLPPGPVYSLFYLAIQELTAGVGLTALRDFCEDVGSGEAWPLTFEAAFESSPESFYTAFEEFRQGLQ